MASHNKWMRCILPAVLVYAAASPGVMSVGRNCQAAWGADETTPRPTTTAAPAPKPPASPAKAAKAGGPKKAAGRTVDRVGLIVNREAVTMGEIEEAVISYYLSQSRRPPEPASPEYQKVRRRVIDGMIEELVLSQEAEAVSVEVSDKEAEKQASAEIETIKKRFESPREFEQGLANEGLTEDQFREDLALKLKRQLMASRVLKQQQQELPSSLVTGDQEVKKAYEGHERDYDQVKFSVIAFRIPEDKRGNAEYKAALVKQAEDMLAELKGGADFAAYAKKYSEDPLSADQGGDAGTLFRYELDPGMARGIFAIPAKGMGVAPTSQGVYVVKVASKKTSTFESAAAPIRERLRRDSTEKAMKKWVQELKDKAYVKEMK